MSSYPGIEKAALLIALDNGGINRFRPQEQQAKELKRWLTMQPEEVLRPVDEWLAGLPDNQLNEVCCGGEGEPEREAAMTGAPPFTDSLLNSYFDEVC